MNNESILITGGSGFVGGHIANSLCEECESISVLAREKSNCRNLSTGKIKIVYGDLRDKVSLSRALDNINIVVHSAALMSDNDNASKNEFSEVNVKGTENLIKSFLNKNGKKQFIYISTVGVYGFTGDAAANESRAYGKGLSPYEWSKAEAEKVVLKYADKLPVTILRLGQLYGPRMAYGWTNVINMIAAGKMKTVGRADALIHLTYIDDVVSAVKKIIGNEKCRGEIFNICGEQIYKLYEVFDAFAAALNKPGPKPVPYLPVYMLSHILRLIPDFAKPKSLSLLTPHRVKFFRNNSSYDISKAKTYFGYNPSTNLREGVERMVEWYVSEYNLDKD